MKRYKTVDEFIAGQDTWKAELIRLREILNSTALEETVKWGGPCYTIGGKNVVGLGSFKNYFGLWFFQGALLKDRNRTLINAQEGTTKALRQWRFGASDEIDECLVGAYVEEAIGNQRKGRVIKADRGKRLEIPAELERMLKEERAA